jgi:glycosyltransferase involved in cell wall biosynthesis
MSNVGIVATSTPATGGTFQYTIAMIDALRRIKTNQYTIFTPPSNHSFDTLGFPIVRLPSAVCTIAKWGLVRVVGKQADLFAGVDKLIAPIYTTYVLASRKPFLFTLHDLQEKYYPQNFTFMQRLWRSLSNKALTAAAAGIICESNCVKSDIERFLGVDSAKIMVIPAPPVSDFMPQHLDPAKLEGLIKKHALPEQFLLYPAQFFPHKNHLRLIEAFALVLKAYPNCHLVLTGQSKYDYDKAMAKAVELGVRSRVIHLGYVDTATLASVYLRAAIVVIPTLFESISIPVYEAFRLGVPVCASRVVALPEQIGDAGILFDPLSITDMAEKIMLLLGDKQLRIELVERGRVRISRLTSEWYAGELQAALDRLK